MSQNAKKNTDGNNQSKTGEETNEEKNKKGRQVNNPNGNLSHTQSVPGFQSNKNTAENSSLGGTKIFAQSMLFPANESNGFAYNSSSNVLRNSSSLYSFTKSSRFPKIVVEGKTQYCELPSGLGERSAGIGYGNRTTFLKSLLSENSPSPHNYHMKTLFETNLSKNKGPFMGIHHRHYKNVYMPGLKTINERGARGIPGPGAYDGQSPIGKDALKMSVRSRIPHINNSLRRSPGPNVYQPSFRLVEPYKFCGVGFGYGPRGAPTTPPHDGSVNQVGPGAYKIPSIFDRYQKKRYNTAHKRLNPIEKQSVRSSDIGQTIE